METQNPTWAAAGDGFASAIMGTKSAASSMRLIISILPFRLKRRSAKKVARNHKGHRRPVGEERLDSHAFRSVSLG